MMRLRVVGEFFRVSPVTANLYTAFGPVQLEIFEICFHMSNESRWNRDYRPWSR